MIKLTEVFLFESKCPACGTEGAYVGLHDVECANRKCKNYNQRAAGSTENFPGPWKRGLKLPLPKRGMRLKIRHDTKLYGLDSDGGDIVINGKKGDLGMVTHFAGVTNSQLEVDITKEPNVNILYYMDADDPANGEHELWRFWDDWEEA